MICNDSVSSQHNDVIGVNPGQTKTLREAKSLGLLLAVKSDSCRAETGFIT